MATRRPVSEGDTRGLLRIAAQTRPRDWQQHVHLEADPSDGQIYVLRWDEASLGRYPAQEAIDDARIAADTVGRLRAQLSLEERIEAIEARLDAAGL